MADQPTEKELLMRRGVGNMHPNAAQKSQEVKEARDELARKMRAINLRQQSMDLVVRLAEHVAVDDPVSLARRIYDFFEEDISSKAEEHGA